MPSYTIKMNGKIVGHIQQKKSGQDSWFWYAAGRNTAATPTTFEQAMRQSAEYLRTPSVAEIANSAPHQPHPRGTGSSR